MKNLPLKGTEFQIKVWKEISKIPYGETRTYKDLAIAIGKPKSFRAVANACGKNPYPPIIPCHRVVRTDGKLGGYSGKGGIKTKKKLLDQEQKQLLSFTRSICSPIESPSTFQHMFFLTGLTTSFCNFFIYHYLYLNNNLIKTKCYIVICLY